MGFFSNLFAKNKDKFDTKMNKYETKGFNFANKMHKYALNGIFLFIAYQLFQFFKSYNDFFLEARKIKKL